MDSLTQAWWRVGLVLQSKGFDIVEQDVGFREQGLAPDFGGVL